MNSSYTSTEVHYHVRSISLPSRLHPSLHKTEKELKTLEASSHQSEATKTGLTGLLELYNSVHQLIACPLTQQALLHKHHHHHHVEKPLDMSVNLLDICGSAREMLLLTKEHVLELQSALRRKGFDSSINSHIGSYICFRKKVKKDMSKRLKELKAMEGRYKSYPLLDVDHHYHLLMVIHVLRELSTITISFFRNFLLFMCGPVLKKTNGWSLFSKIVFFDRQKRNIKEMGDIDVALCSFCRKVVPNKSDVDIVKRRLGEFDWNIRELEAGLDCLFRCLIQQRVSLLNLLTR